MMNVTRKKTSRTAKVYKFDKIKLMYLFVLMCPDLFVHVNAIEPKIVIICALFANVRYCKRTYFYGNFSLRFWVSDDFTGI